MDQSIMLQFNRALDEYIASHYVPIQLLHPVFDERLELDECSEEREKVFRRQPDRLPSTAKKKRAAKAPPSIKETAETVFQDVLSVFKRASSTPPTAESIDPLLDIDDFLRESKKLETFTDSLLRIIREKELVEADVYNSVFMDRKLFNKIRNDRNYQPTKRTALLLSVALRLTVEETQTFLEKAGYSLTHTSKVDIVIEFFMLQGNYNIHDINEALYDRDLPLLNPRT